jgi:Cof subfamily protein (haloacid dehalogenase superfamily)
VTYKLLAVDLDGTLVRRDGTVHADDSAAIERLQAVGVPVTIVTGRLYSGSVDVARRVGIRGPIACVDGSHIVDPIDAREHVHHAIDGADAAALRRIVERHRTASFLFAQDAIVHDPRGEAFVPYVQTWSPNISVVDRVTAHPHWEHERGVLAVVAVGPDAQIDAMVREVRDELGHAALVVSFAVARFAGTSALVVRALGPTKGTAIEWLATHHGCTTAEIVVVGDWLNDVPMFEVAGRSFVMGQAPEHVKARATDALAADTWSGGGIAEAVAAAWRV